jgi:class I fructose-bisphosphate aldolase
MYVQARLNRLMAPNGNCFAVAIDHGFYNVPRLLTNIENMRDVIEAVIVANPDVVLLTPGQAPLLQSVPGKVKPSLALRVDVTNAFYKKRPKYLFCDMLERPVEQALRLDAAAIVVDLFDVKKQPEIHDQSIRNINRLKSTCDRYGMPLIIEPFAMSYDKESGRLVDDSQPERVIPLIRQAVELGADIIKADPTTEVENFRRVVEVAGDVPVLVRGGGRVSEEEVIQRTHTVMQQGARGIVYGRNIIQHPNPSVITRAFMAIVHENATPDEALAILKAW